MTWLAQSSSSLILPDTVTLVSAKLDLSALNEKTLLEFALQNDIAVPTTLDRAVLKRRADFIAGRFCACRALVLAGLSGSSEVGTGENRSPIWPSGWVGSITHTEGYSAAAVARANSLRAIGIDSERLFTEQVCEEVSAKVLVEGERMLFERSLVSAVPFSQFVSVVFAVKESLFKALNPLTGTYFDMENAELTALDFSKGTARWKLLTELSGEFTTGKEGPARFSMDATYVHAGVMIA